MVQSTIFVSASDARQNSFREIVIHDEARSIESEILQAIKIGLFEATVSDGTTMTNSSVAPVDVWSIDPSNNQLYIPNHGLSTGDEVTLNSNVSLPGPLLSTSYYYVIYIDSNHIKLSNSFADAISGRPIGVSVSQSVNLISLTNNGSGYIFPPAISFSGGNPNDTATATAILSTWGNVLAIANSTSGSNYIDQPTISITAQGSGASAGAVSYSTVGITLGSAGTSYNISDVISVSGGTGVASSAIITQIDSNGAILAINLRNPGLYTALPTLTNVATTVLPSGGSGATVNLTIGIAAIAVSVGGTGYTQQPRVIINDISGIGAVITAIIQGGAVNSFIVDEPGYGYVGVSSVIVDSGSLATATAVLQPTSIGGLVLLNNGGNTYSTIPTVNVIPNGSGATISTIYMTVSSVQLAFSGDGYSQNDMLLISGGITTSNAYIRVVCIDSIGAIISYTLESGGTYTSPPVLDFNLVVGGTGTGASFNVFLGVSAADIDSGGHGYIVPPIITIDPPTLNPGVQSICQALLTGNSVSSFQFVTIGSGYINIPNISISNGSGCEVVANLTPTVLSNIIINNGGSGYSFANVVVSGGGFANVAVANATVVGGSVSNIDLLFPGIAYTSVPFINIVGDGSGALASANLVATSIESLAIISNGGGFNYPPNVSISGSAIAIATLTPTGINNIIVNNIGQNYVTIPTVNVIPGTYQTGTPTSPILTISLGFSIASVQLTTTGDGYYSIPTVSISSPQSPSGTTATATATIGIGSGTFVLMPYYSSRDYFNAWQNLILSNPQLSRPYSERMATIIAYFTNLGYTITQMTNPATNNTFQWFVMW